MGGGISVESETGRGTQFRLDLPFEIGIEAALPEGRRELKDLRGLEVLVVGGVATNRLVLEGILGGWECGQR